MPPKISHPSDSQNLTSWEARQFREMQLDTLEKCVERLDRIERDNAYSKGKQAAVMVFGSTLVSIVVHMITQYLGMHK